jgi:hypothetical protein
MAFIAGTKSKALDLITVVSSLAVDMRDLSCALFSAGASSKSNQG